MCGRTAISLCAEDVCCACNYMNKSTGKYSKPEWRDENNFGKSYTPSPNLAPTDISPVLISASHYDNNETYDRILVPMMWGMIPPWHKGDYKSHGLSTNNCRLENMCQSKLYGPAFRNGQRCVVLAEGFYEWQTEGPKNKTKTPYYIYMPQNIDVKIEDPKTWPENKWYDDEGWNGVDLLKLAGLFNVWTNENGEKIYSYSVITLESNDTLSWLHHRMPVIFENNEQVDKWLDYKNVPNYAALSVLKAGTKLKWHEVDTLVNNSRNKSELCNKPVNITRKKSKSSAFMDNWLNTKKRKSEDTDSINNPDKKIK